MCNEFTVQLTFLKPQMVKLLIFKNWSLIYLHCCISFWCTANWFSYTYVNIFFHILFHYGLLQDIEYSSLCQTVETCYLSILYIVCYLSILYIVVCICHRRQWHPTPVLLLGKSHERRSLVGCSPWGRWGLDCSLPGSSVPGIFQARVLEWGAIAFYDIYTLLYIK